ncbi:MAG: hypothetical protein V7K35_00400 [Nostoc sp.]|uniref:hypothetical protein n=1 Tax=Nostoc sp. TaxID=1180 RepID=UPI002FFCD227
MSSGQLIVRVQSKKKQSLGKILQDNQHRFEVVKGLSGYWRLNDEYYYLAWECAQNMPYPDFYQA